MIEDIYTRICLILNFLWQAHLLDPSFRTDHPVRRAFQNRIEEREKWCAESR